MRWVLREPSRFLQEQHELERLQKEADWLISHAWKIDPNFTIEVDIDLRIRGTPYSLTLTYPDLFPDTLPFIRPRNRTHSLSIHQYGPGGSLCLEWRADNWDRSKTGADLVRSAHRLLESEAHPETGEPIISAHQETEGQKLRGSKHRLACTPRLMAVLSEIPNGSYRNFRYVSIVHSSTTVGFVSAVGMKDDMTRIDDLPSGISSHFPLFAWSEDGSALRSSAFDNVTLPPSFDVLTALIEQGSFSADSVLFRDSKTGDIKSQLLLFIGDDPKRMQAIATYAGEQQSLHKYDVIMPEIGQRLPTDSDHLGSIRFGIVGLGSIGSKVAISLARSGARRFLLVDDDYLAAQNVCRHELSWAAVGMDKVDAVFEALKLIRPDLDVTVLSHRVAGQESALFAAATLKDLSKCDVLVDATANPEVFLRLAAIAKIEKLPMCWGEIFAGGIGGMIARARPEVDPNPLAVRRAFLAYLEDLPPAPFKKADGYDVGTEEPLVAHDGDVTQIASALTQLIIDTTRAQKDSLFPYSVYLIGLRKAWIFGQPFDTRPVNVEGTGWEGSVDTPSLAADREEAFKAVLGMIERVSDADADSTS